MTHWTWKRFVRLRLNTITIRYDDFFNCVLPGSIKVDILSPAVAPPSVDRGAEAPVLGFLQSGEAVSEETLEAGLGGFQHCHVFQPAVNLRNSCVRPQSLGEFETPFDQAPWSDLWNKIRQVFVLFVPLEAFSSLYWSKFEASFWSQHSVKS